MGIKWAVVYEYDLKEGFCFMARKEAGKGEIALFDSREQAEEWVQSSEDIDEDFWDINYVTFEV